jgi:hypothetical protein
VAKTTMQALLRYFWQLALLRATPQDLPAAPALLILIAGAGVLVGALNGRDLFGGFAPALGANLLELLLSLAMLMVALRLQGFAGRLVQSASAFLGLGLLAGIARQAVVAAGTIAGGNGLLVFADVVLAVWLHFALGHVLRHALEIPLMAGVVVVFSYTIMAFNIIVQVFPVVQ